MPRARPGCPVRARSCIPKAPRKVSVRYSDWPQSRRGPMPSPDGRCRSGRMRRTWPSPEPRGGSSSVARRADSNIYRLGLRGPGEPEAEPERLIASTRLENNPEYSPKGDAVAFMSSRSGSTEIWLSNADGSNPRQLTSMGGPLTANPRWSPDGTTILFDSRLKGSADLYVVSVQGGSPRPLTDQPSLENEASWSRDGRFIYFGSDRTGRREVWRMPASGGEATQVTRDGGSCPFESPDGRWLYYAKRPRFDLWKAPVAGGAETRVLENLSYCFNYVPTSHGVYFVRAGLAEQRACGNSGGVPRLRNGQDQAPASHAGLGCTG